MAYNAGNPFSLLSLQNHPFAAAKFADQTSEQWYEYWYNKSVQKPIANGKENTLKAKHRNAKAIA